MEKLNEGVTVTDERTLMQEEIDSLTAEKKVAYDRIKALANDLAAKGDLLDVMTAANARVKREMQDMKVRHHAETEKARKLADEREMVALVLGAVIGFVAAGLIVVMYYMIRGGR